MTDKRPVANQTYDMKFRAQVPTNSVIAETGRWIKNTTRDEERRRWQRALQAYWAPFAYKERPEVSEVALESILELTEQILQIALLSGLPIDQLNFKNQVLTIIQQRIQKGGATEPQSSPPSISQPSQPNGAAPQKSDVRPLKTEPAKRKTIFDD